MITICFHTNYNFLFNVHILLFTASLPGENSDCYEYIEYVVHFKQIKCLTD